MISNLLSWKDKLYQKVHQTINNLLYQYSLNVSAFSYDTNC